MRSGSTLEEVILYVTQHGITSGCTIQISRDSVTGKQDLFLSVWPGSLTIGGFSDEWKLNKYLSNMPNSNITDFLGVA